MTDPAFWGQVILETLTLSVLVVGLLGLVIPVFPGLVVMWLAALLYAIVQASIGNMTVWEWLLFVLITTLMIVGSVIDNIIIAKSIRDKDVPWSSILWGYVAGIVGSLAGTPLIGILAAPLGLFLAEYYRQRDRTKAFESTKAYMTGWGLSFAARFGIGLGIVFSWMLWAWI
jgi:uncharacterized protein YqgC (DUF456 family)